MIAPGPAIFPGPGLYPGGSSEASQLVGIRTPRMAAFVTTGATSANFTRPTVSASFAQADAFVIRP